MSEPIVWKCPIDGCGETCAVTVERIRANLGPVPEPFARRVGRRALILSHVFDAHPRSPEGARLVEDAQREGGEDLKGTATRVIYGGPSEQDKRDWIERRRSNG